MSMMFSPESDLCLQTHAIWRINRWLFLTALPFKLTNDAAQFVGPVFLNLLLGVVSKGQPSSLGYTYAGLMLLGLWIGTLTDNQHFQRVMRAGGQTACLHKLLHRRHGAICCCMTTHWDHMTCNSWV